MGRNSFGLLRPAVVGVVALVLVAGGGTVALVRVIAPPAAGPARAAAAAPLVIPDLLPESDEVPKLRQPAPPPPPKPKPKPAPRRTVKAAPKPAGPNLAPFKGLGAWVDLYDGELDPVATTEAMDDRGVRTLYLQTGRYNVPAGAAETFPPDWIDRWLHAAHDRGLKVVGWYVPAYEYMARDVRRTTAIATYRSSRGDRFDGLGIDIEYRRLVKRDAWMAAVVTHATAVRKAVPRTLAVAGIVQPPLLMDTAPDYWAGFPWQGLGAQVDVMMPMAYWTATDDDCKTSADYCAFGYTKRNVEEVRRRTGRSAITVHVIGGVGDECSTQQVADYVRAALSTSSYGGSLYDFGVTKPDFWAHLARLNR